MLFGAQNTVKGTTCSTSKRPRGKKKIKAEEPEDLESFKELGNEAGNNLINAKQKIKAQN